MSPRVDLLRGVIDSSRFLRGSGVQGHWRGVRKVFKPVYRETGKTRSQRTGDFLFFHHEGLREGWEGGLGLHSVTNVKRLHCLLKSPLTKDIPSLKTNVYTTGGGRLYDRRAPDRRNSPLTVFGAEGRRRFPCLNDGRNSCLGNRLHSGPYPGYSLFLFTLSLFFRRGFSSGLVNFIFVEPKPHYPVILPSCKRN